MNNVPRLCLILIFTIFLYLPALSQSFVSWDDEGHLIENFQVRSLDSTNIKNIFQSDVNKTYIPLTIFSFAVEYHFFGYNPFIYHLDNLLLHLGVLIVLYFLALRLGLSAMAASVSALLFAIHPMHVESVVWVTQRKDVLYSLFYVLALIQYVSYVQTNRRMSYFLVVMFGTLSILAKPMAMSLPFILVLVDWFLGRPVNKRIFVEKAPFALIIFSIAWITYAMNMRAVDVQFPQSLLTWLWCLSFYLGKFLFPADLLVLYQLPAPVSLLNPEFLFAIAFLAVLIFLVVRFRANRSVVFAFVYYFLSVFFLLRFDAEQDLTFVADRFMYLPSLGLCVLIGWGMGRLLSLAKDRTVRLGMVMSMVAVFFVLAVLTSNRVRAWGDEYVLWNAVAERYPSAVAHSQLGNYFLKKQEFEKAWDHYQKAIGLNARYSKPYSNSGTVLVKLGRFDEALGLFTQAMALEPKASSVLLNNRGYAYMRLTRYPEAFADFERAIQADPVYLPAYLNRATWYKNQNNRSAAMDDLQQVLRIDPDNQTAQNNIQILKGMMNESAR